MVRSRVFRACATLVAALSLILVIPFAGANFAHADETTDRISADDLAAKVPFTVTATEDISGRTLVAIRLATYAMARTDGTNITGLDVTDAGYAKQIDNAIKAAKIDTSQPTTGITYDATNPMPWVMENLLQASSTPWEDTTPPNLRAFMTELRKQFTGTGAPTAVTDTQYTMESVAGNAKQKQVAEATPGVYMVLDTTTGDAGTTTSTDRASIPMINGTGVQYTPQGGEATVLTNLKKDDSTSYTLGNVEYKVTEVTTTKQVKGPETGAEYADQASAQMGQTVTFKLTTTVPNYTGYDTAQLKLRDTLSKGLAFGEINKVTVTPATSDAEATELAADSGKWSLVAQPTDVTGNGVGTGVDGKDYTFDILFAPQTDNGVTKSNLVQSADTKTAFPIGATVTVEYTAVLTSQATIAGDGNLNTVNALYSHNPNNTDDLEKTPDSTSKVYTGQIQIKKVDMSGKVLPGAKFTITRSGDSSALTVVEETANSGTYHIYDTKETAPTGESTTTLTVPESGELTIKGLEGTYSIKETSSPLGNGVLLPTFGTTVTTKATTANNVTTVATTVTGPTGDIHKLVKALPKSESDTTVIGFTVQNARNILSMPKTGATWLALYALAAVVFGGAGFALVWKSRKRN